MRLSLLLMLTLTALAVFFLAPESEAGVVRRRNGRSREVQAYRRTPAVSSRRNVRPAQVKRAKQARLNAIRTAKKQKILQEMVRRRRLAAIKAKKTVQKARAGRRLRGNRRNGRRLTTRRRSKANSRRYSVRRPAARRYNSARRGRYSYRRRGRQEDLNGNAITEDAVAATEEVDPTLAEDPAFLDPIDDAELQEEDLEGETMEDLMDDLLNEEIEEEALMEALDDMADDNDKREVTDANGDGIPDWCNPIKPMGAWLNFRNMKIWCADRGYTNFGPYGGVPKTTNGNDAAAPAPVDDLVDTNALGDEGLDNGDVLF